jgi:ABC-type uncharacterized transport system permease subunit
MAQPDTPLPDALTDERLAIAPEPVMQRVLMTILRTLGCAVGVLVLLILTFVLLGIAPDVAINGLITGALGNAADGHWYAVSETLVKTCPLLLAGLSVIVAWRAGMFSIGGEGQLLMGALAAMILLKALPKLPPPLLTLLMLAAGIAAGALWGGIAGWLRARRNVQEVISTIMLNYIALYLVGALVSGPLQEHTHVSPQTEPVPDAVLFARLVPPALAGGMPTRLHSGLLLALLAVPVVYVFLYRTPAGFGLRVMGQNPEAARVARFPIESLRIRAMLISGALCGLAGVVELLGISARLDANFSSGWGYTAIPVALLGGLDPIGTLFSALFFGGLTAGCGYLSRFSGVSATLIYVIQAAAVLSVVGARAWQSRRSGTDTE